MSSATFKAARSMGKFSETLIGTDGRDHFNDGAGDDIIVVDWGDHFNVDVEMTIYGDSIAGALDEGNHDSVGFDGEYEQFNRSVKQMTTGVAMSKYKTYCPALLVGHEQAYDIEIYHSLISG